MSRLRSFLGFACVVLLVGAIFSQREEILQALVQLEWQTVIWAQVAVLAGLTANVLSWRATVRSLGYRLRRATAARVFLLSQLGKYAPGSVWPVLAQAELGREHGIPRTRSGAAAVIALAVGIVTAVAIGLPLLALTSGGIAVEYWWVGILAALTLIVLYPPFLSAILSRILVHAGREPLSEAPNGPDLLVAAGWSVAMWGLFGAQCYLIARDLGAGATVFATCVAAFALSWVVGFLVVVAPAGAGAREVALILFLSPVLGRTDALTVALMSRVLMSVGDLVAAGGAMVWGRRASRALP